jgi:glucosamine-6-phosphate deaminase
MVKKAVCWLGNLLNKSVLKLTTEDYNENGLEQLITMYKKTNEINIKVFNQL